MSGGLRVKREVTFRIQGCGPLRMTPKYRRKQMEIDGIVHTEGSSLFSAYGVYLTKNGSRSLQRAEVGLQRLSDHPEVAELIERAKRSAS